MIKLFLADIDGCLSQPYQDIRLDEWQRLREWAVLGETDPRYPRLGLCSGRPYSYVEAVAQVLGIRGPILFESGTGRLELPTGKIIWSDALTPEVENELTEVRNFILREIAPFEPVTVEHGKRAQAGVISLNSEVLARVVTRLHDLVESSYPDLAVADTKVSVDVYPKFLSKQTSVEWMAREMGLELSEIAFIGDSRGDMGALRIVGKSFAPANAQRIVKDVVDTITSGSVIEGTIEAYEWCIRYNESETVDNENKKVTSTP